MHTTMGTLNASAIAKCSFDIPIKPALAPTMRITQDGAPDVKPYNVVFKYLSWPARSVQSIISHDLNCSNVNKPMKDTILAALMDISSHPSFSCRIASASAGFAVLGNIGVPEGSNPRICD